MAKHFWHGKRVFITGHTGFKGSWLSIWLKQLGASVVGYALPPKTNPSLFELAEVANGMTSIEGDILNIAHLQAAIKQASPEIVFHLAAQPLVSLSYQKPIETYQVNVMGTANILEVVRNTNTVRVVIVVTSDKCYENKEWVWGYRETDAMGGFDPYSSSKGCTELLLASYRQSFFNPERYPEHQVTLATVRAGNVLGGGDLTLSRLVPDLILSFMRKQRALIRCPHAHRPWQHVLDLLRGYLLVTEKLWNEGNTFSGAWNFGPHDDNVKPVSWIANKLVELWGDGASWSPIDSNHLHEAICLKLDSNKSRTYLGWTPKMTIEEILEKTCAWYQAMHAKNNMVQFTEQQINAYESR